MAVKDHSLDSKITDSAMEEFMTYGFKSSSINKIAEHAGVTTGAVYTRYKNKDELFVSLLQKPLKSMAERGRAVAPLYAQVKSKADFPLFIQAMDAEMEVCMDVIFEYYDECVLLYCKSGGSSAEQMLRKMMEEKVRSTVDFLQSLSHRDMTGVEILVMQQVELLKLILQSGYSKEQARQVAELLSCYNEAGWKAIFEHM